jgi:hypothetical protein
MRGPSEAWLSLRCTDDSGVSLVTKRSYLTPELTTVWYSRTRALRRPSPVPAEGVDGPGPGPDFTAVRHASWDEVSLTGPQGNFFRRNCGRLPRIPRFQGRSKTPFGPRLLRRA